MNREQFVSLASSKGIRSDAFSIGIPANEAYIIEKSIFGWTTYYSERGRHIGARRFFSESVALKDLYGRLSKDMSTRESIDA